MNLVIMGVFYKRIQIEIANAEDIDESVNMVYCLKNRRRILPFSKLKDLQQKLKFKTEDASVHLKTLSDYFLIWIRLQTLTASLLMEPFFLIFMFENY
jgi:hypothetical protein